MKNKELARLALTYENGHRSPAECLQLATDEARRRNEDYIRQNAADIDEIFICSDKTQQ